MFQENKRVPTDKQTAIAEFGRGSASDLLSFGRGSVIILVAYPRQFVGKSPMFSKISALPSIQNDRWESEINSHRSAAISVMADC